MRTLLPRDLRPGDVLLSKGARSTISEIIRAIDGSEYSHAALWSGTGVIESVIDGIQERPLEVSLAEGKRSIMHVYRHPDMASAVPNPVVEQARKYVGGVFAEVELYLLGVAYAAAFVLPGRGVREAAKLSLGSLWRELSEAHRLLAAMQNTRGCRHGRAHAPMTCSTLIATAFRDGGLPLTIDISGARRLAGHKGSASAPNADAATGHPERHAEVEAFLQTIAACFPELTEVAKRARDRLPSGLETKALVSTARDWPLSLVTPRDISTALPCKGKLPCPA
ncbi:MAG: hypothetical protein OXU20_16975 [Myxococcales bacterium]|nr:hypothetical protein [Myxococcales bacterium]MDD9968583.1 hypothetical protein [Myxococcales bacterium]